MQEKDAKIAKSILGDDILEVLKKTEIYKPSTKTTVDPDEIKIALQIVPRAILSYLFAHLKHKLAGDVIDLDLPFAPGKLHLNKLGTDNYSGEIVSLEGKRLSQFQNRSLPSIGLILLSTFELYDLSLLDEIKKDTHKDNDKVSKLQDLIDERLALHNLISDVVDRRMSHREAMARLINEKLASHISYVNSHPQKEEPMNEEDKKSKLRQFLENRERKRDEDIELDKSEVKCPDCSFSLYKGGDKIKLCICYGDHHNKEIKIKKSEDGKVRLKFPKSFDIDNIEMLLDSLKNK